MQHPVSAAPNSWVHKQYMSERDFEIEHAADTHYHEVEPHYHEFYELFFFLNGHIDYVVEDQIFEMRRGDCWSSRRARSTTRFSAISTCRMSAMCCGFPRSAWSG